MSEVWLVETSVSELGEGCSGNEWKDSCELLGKTRDSRRSAIAGDKKSGQMQ